jgi:hypothetical protein
MSPPVTVPSPLGTGINIELFFRYIYECLVHGCRTGIGDYSSLIATLWQWIVIIGYILIVVGLLFIVYCLMRIFELRRREEEQFEELIIKPGNDGPNPRWAHIDSLMDSKDPASWRQAIIEADIVLDEMLTRQGYKGASVGDKLKQVEASDFDTLQDAWEAHKVRNQIAHAGMDFDLSETLARRTIARYEAVFREFRFI